MRLGIALEDRGEGRAVIAARLISRQNTNSLIYEYTANSFNVVFPKRKGRWMIVYT